MKTGLGFGKESNLDLFEIQSDSQVSAEELFDVLYSQKGEQIKNFLDENIVGQQTAKQVVVDILETLIASKGLIKDGNPNKPIASILFVGPSGVGKTQLAIEFQKVLNKYFGEKNEIIKVNCADYKDNGSGSSLTKLLGAPPGYISCDKKSKFHPDNIQGKGRVILFDEIEKGGEAMKDAMLSILDDGTAQINYVDTSDSIYKPSNWKKNSKFNNGNEKEVSENQEITAYFKEAVIIMTSNMGTREMLEMMNGGMGFGTKKSSCDDVNEKMQDIVMKAIDGNFKLEMQGRIDYIVPFVYLNKDEYMEILNRKLNSLREKYVKNINNGQLVFFKMSDNSKNLLVNMAVSNNKGLGIRRLEQLINKHINAVLSKAINDGIFQDGKVCLDIQTDGKQFVYKISQMGTENNGIIRL
ncbi:MAG: AAA family ATPase [Candidatus Absconditabacteria bacterium]